MPGTAFTYALVSHGFCRFSPNREFLGPVVSLGEDVLGYWRQDFSLLQKLFSSPQSLLAFLQRLTEEGQGKECSVEGKVSVHVLTRG